MYVLKIDKQKKKKKKKRKEPCTLKCIVSLHLIQNCYLSQKLFSVIPSQIWAKKKWKRKKKIVILFFFFFVIFSLREFRKKKKKKEEKKKKKRDKTKSNSKEEKKKNPVSHPKTLVFFLFSPAFFSIYFVFFPTKRQQHFYSRVFKTSKLELVRSFPPGDSTLHVAVGSGLPVFLRGHYILLKIIII